MGPNFLECDRDQVLLLPPSLREWLPAGHLAWFVIDAVERLDLMAFYSAYRLDGQGRAAHEPSMMVALLLYSYAVGGGSPRRFGRGSFGAVPPRWRTRFCRNTQLNPWGPMMSGVRKAVAGGGGGKKEGGGPG